MHAVVQEILCSVEQESTYLGRTARFNLRADAWLLDEDFQSVFDVLSYGTTCSEPVLGPPFGVLLDFALGARLDAVRERHG